MAQKIKVLIFIFALHFVNQNCIAQENTLLWEIKGNGLKKSSYLYGTYHSQDARAHQFGDSVLAKLNKTNMVVVENTDVSGLSSKESLDMCLMKNETLENLLSKEDFTFIKSNALKIMGMSGLLFNTMKPMFTMIMISQTSLRKEMK